MKFESFNLSHIPRGENTHTDSLVTPATSSTQSFPWVIIVEDLYTPTPSENDVCPGSSSQSSAELDGFHIEIPRKWHFARRENRSWENKEESSSVLVIRGQKVIQTVLLWAVPTLCTSRYVRVAPRGAAWRHLWKSYGRKVPIAPGHYSRILVAKYAEGSAGVC